MTYERIPPYEGVFLRKVALGQCANGGREYPPQGQPERVQTHAVPAKELGKMCP